MRKRAGCCSCRSRSSAGSTPGMRPNSAWLSAWSCARLLTAAAAAALVAGDAAGEASSSHSAVMAPGSWPAGEQPKAATLLHQLLSEMSIVSCRKAGITHACGKSYSEMLLLMLLMLLMLFMSWLW